MIFISGILISMSSNFSCELHCGVVPTSYKCGEAWCAAVRKGSMEVLYTLLNHWAKFTCSNRGGQGDQGEGVNPRIGYSSGLLYRSSYRIIGGILANF